MNKKKICSVVETCRSVSQLDIISNQDQAVIYGEQPRICAVYPISFSGNVKTEQRNDSDLSILWNWLVSKTVPTNAQLALASPAAKHYWINKAMYRWRSCLIWKQSEEDKLLVVIPGTMKKTMLSACHDLPAAGHQGVDRTVARLKEKYHWYGMSQAAKTYVQSCKVCNSHKKPTRHSRFPLTNFQAGAPMKGYIWISWVLFQRHITETSTS